MYAPEMFGELPNAAVTVSSERRCHAKASCVDPAARRAAGAHCAGSWLPAPRCHLREVQRAGARRTRHCSTATARRSTVRVDLTDAACPGCAWTTSRPRCGRVDPAGRGPALIAAWRRSTGAVGCRRVGQSVRTSPHARRLDAHDAARRSAGPEDLRRRARAGAASRRNWDAGAGGARAGSRLAQAPDPRSLPEPGRLIAASCSRRRRGRRACCSARRPTRTGRGARRRLLAACCARPTRARPESRASAPVRSARTAELAARVPGHRRHHRAGRSTRAVARAEPPALDRQARTGAAAGAAAGNGASGTSRTLHARRRPRSASPPTRCAATWPNWPSATSRTAR